MVNSIFSRYSARKKNQQKHKDAGLCVHCSKKAEPNKTCCSKHLKYQRESQRKHIKNLKKMKYTLSQCSECHCMAKIIIKENKYYCGKCNAEKQLWQL